MSETYTIETLNDFLKVPEDRLDACFSEFKSGLAMARVVDALYVGKPHPPPMTKFTWIDDGEKNITVNLQIKEAKP